MNKLILEKLDELDDQSNEAYKTLRTNILFSGSKIKVICLTSCTPNEGKSSISLNLARSFADSGQKVALIDADLRKSVLIGRYKIQKQEYGLSCYLSGQNSFEECMNQTNLENVDMMLCGPVPPNPVELLESEQFAALIERCRADYDYVIIDTPPLGVVIDGAIIASQSDGAILVIETNKISYKFAQKVKNQLGESHCGILGVILNKIEVRKTLGSHYKWE